MRISDYSRFFRKGSEVEVAGLLLEPPDLDDVDAGFDAETSASETVELQRALTGWLIFHKQRFPEWHREYRRRNPGGDQVRSSRGS